MELPGGHGEHNTRIIRDAYISLSKILSELDDKGNDLADAPSFLNIRWREVYPEEEFHPPVLYIFQDKNQLMYIERGNVYNGSWQVLQDNRSVIIEYHTEHFRKKELYDLAYFSDDILILVKHGSSAEHPVGKYLFLANEKTYPQESIEELSEEITGHNSASLKNFLVYGLIILFVILLLLRWIF